MKNQLVGEYGIVIGVDGKVDMKHLINSKNESIFDKSKGEIGCSCLDYLVIGNLGENRLALLVNDNGYGELGDNPSNINQVATYIVYGEQKRYNHYILGNAVICILTKDEDGCNFVGMSEDLASHITKTTNDTVSERAKKVVYLPAKIPEPKMSIMTFETAEEMFRHMSGDSSVTPKTVETFPMTNGES